MTLFSFLSIALNENTAYSEIKYNVRESSISGRLLINWIRERACVLRVSVTIFIHLKSVHPICFCKCWELLVCNLDWRRQDWVDTTQSYRFPVSPHSFKTIPQDNDWPSDSINSCWRWSTAGSALANAALFHIDVHAK